LQLVACGTICRTCGPSYGDDANKTAYN